MNVIFLDAYTQMPQKASSMTTLTSTIETAFAPGLDWIGRWLPLFYVPSLVVLPVVLKSIDALMLARIAVIIVFGLLSSLIVTAKTAFVIREAVKTKLVPVPPAPPVAPFSDGIKIVTAGVGIISLAIASLLGTLPPSATSTHAAPLTLFSAFPRMAATAFLIASTVGGYIAGCELPAGVRKILHPIISTAIAANVGAAVLAAATGTGYISVLRFYLLKGSGTGLMGAGDVLMAFLGSVILSFGFRIFSQREIMKRHRYEVFGCVMVSAIFSLLVTTLAGRLIGLEPTLTKAIAPRSVTVALALPIASALGGTPETAPITAAAVVLTGLLGAAVAQQTLDAFGFKGDPIARGMATAGSAHGLGTAALARDEPEALPFCALAYGLMGIVSTLLVSAKPIADLLIAIAG